MNSLRDWLQQNKLEQYAEAFEANDIDLDILSELTEGGSGKARRFRSAIAAGCLKALAERSGKRTSRHSDTLHSGPGRLRRRGAAAGHGHFRRIVGSTDCRAALDPETVGALFRGYQDAAALIAQYGGLWPNSWAMACWPISAGRRPAKMLPSGRFAPALGSCRWRSKAGWPAAPNAGRHRCGPGRGRRVRRQRVGPGTRHCRRNSQSRRATSGAGEPDCVLDQRSDAPVWSAACSRWIQRRTQPEGFPRPYGLVRVARSQRRKPIASGLGAAASMPAFSAASRNWSFSVRAGRKLSHGKGEGQVIAVLGEAGIGKSRMCWFRCARPGLCPAAQ